MVHFGFHLLVPQNILLEFMISNTGTLTSYLSLTIYVLICFYLSFYRYIYLSIDISIFLWIYLSFYRYIYLLSIYLSKFLSLYLSIYIFIYLIHLFFNKLWRKISHFDKEKIHGSLNFEWK